MLLNSLGEQYKWLNICYIRAQNTEKDLTHIEISNIIKSRHSLSKCYLFINQSIFQSIQLWWGISIHIMICVMYTWTWKETWPLFNCIVYTSRLSLEPNNRCFNYKMNPHVLFIFIYIWGNLITIIVKIHISFVFCGHLSFKWVLLKLARQKKNTHFICTFNTCQKEKDKNQIFRQSVLGCVKGNRRGWSTSKLPCVCSGPQEAFHVLKCVCARLCFGVDLCISNTAALPVFGGKRLIS